LEGRDLLGWAIHKAEIKDLLVGTPRNVLEHSKLGNKGEEEYFASSENPGAGKALNGTAESAWWAKHLAWNMTIICGGVTVLLLVLSLLLLVAVGSMQGPIGIQDASKLVTSTLTVVFSLGLVQLTYNYYIFSRACDQIERDALSQLEAGAPDKEKAIRLLHDYQVARATAPPIPSWIYRVRKDELNKKWKYI
jgi:hypothetical protein